MGKHFVKWKKGIIIFFYFFFFCFLPLLIPFRDNLGGLSTSLVVLYAGIMSSPMVLLSTPQNWQLSFGLCILFIISLNKHGWSCCQGLIGCLHSIPRGDIHLWASIPVKDLGSRFHPVSIVLRYIIIITYQW